MDWIETFIADTDGLSPVRFRTWAGIMTIAGVLERRVWTEHKKGLVFPNMYSLLCGGAGSGKTIMVNMARKFWACVPDLRIAPDNPNHKTFLTALENSQRTFMDITGEIHQFSAMSVASREMGVLIPKYEPQFVQHLSDLWDNLDRFTAPRETTKSTDITKPTVNILAGATPAYLGDMFPEVAWRQGFTSRLLFIFGESLLIEPDYNAFKKKGVTNVDKLQSLLNTIFSVIGECIWADEAQIAHNHWVIAGMPPQPDFGRLETYNTRREVFVIKLAMISAMSRTQHLLVTLADYERARKWLLDAEHYMPDVFRAMSFRSDSDLIKELYWEVYKEWGMQPPGGRKGVHKNFLWKILETKTVSTNIPKVIDAAINAGYIKETSYPNLYEPRAKVNGNGQLRVE